MAFNESIHEHSCFKKVVQKGGSSRLNRLHLLPADTVEHTLRRALLQYAQVAELATHARYLHSLQRTRGFALQGLEYFGGGQPLRSL